MEIESNAEEDDPAGPVVNGEDAALGGRGTGPPAAMNNDR
jgi:hypothetical protein